MKKTTSFKGIIPLAISLILCFGSFMLYESAFKLTFWLHINVLHGGTKIGYNAAVIVSVLYSIVTYTAVVLLIASITRLLYKKSLFECTLHQVYRYTYFYALLPVLIVAMAWDNFWRFAPASTPVLSTLISNFGAILDFASAFCEAVLFLTVAVTIASIIAFAYRISVKSNIYLNRIYIVIWIIYGFYVFCLLAQCYEFGKWMLVFILASYLITAVALTLHYKADKADLTPKYKLTLTPVGEINDCDTDTFMSEGDENNED